MKKKYFLSIPLVTIVITVLLIPISYADYCQAYIVNNSQKNWTFQATTSDGSFCFMNGTLCQTAPYTISPGATETIHYIYDGGYIIGAMTITDTNNVPKKFNFSEVSGQCPYIDHDGRTGAVALNNPHWGDYKIVGDNW